MNKNIRERYAKCSQAEKQQVRTIILLFFEVKEITNMQKIFEIARDSILMERDYFAKKSLERFPHVKIINDDPYIPLKSYEDAKERFNVCSQAEQKCIFSIFHLFNTKKVHTMQKIFEIARDYCMIKTLERLPYAKKRHCSI